jgi:hypothetical protein
VRRTVSSDVAQKREHLEDSPNQVSMRPVCSHRRQSPVVKRGVAAPYACTHLLHTRLQAHPQGDTHGVDRQPDLLPQRRHAHRAQERFPHGSTRPGGVETACSISPPALQTRQGASKTPSHADVCEACATGVWPGLAVRQPCPFPGIPDALTFPGRSTLNRGHEHQRLIRRCNARDGRPRCFGGTQRGSGT